MTYPSSIDTSIAGISRDRFRFGFALYSRTTPVADEVLTGWSRFDIDGFVLRVHPESDVLLVRTPEGRAAVVGDIFVAHGSESLQALITRVVDGQDWSALDSLSGRFAMVIFGQGGPQVVNDAAGSRTVYYRKSGRALVGSHAVLVATLAGDSISREVRNYMETPEYRIKRTRFLPGDITMFKEIVGLSPNNVYDLGLRRTVRIWPRGEPVGAGLDDFVDLCDEYFQNYARFLTSARRPVVGLTGGVDSRATISGLTKFGARPALSTWTGLPDDEMMRIRTMVEHLGLDHEFVDTGAKPVGVLADSRRDAAHVNTGYWRGRSLLPAQVAETARPGDVFVRGYGGEILRGSYHSSQFAYGAEPHRLMVRLYMTRAVRDPGAVYTAFTGRAFGEFMDRANYVAIPAGFDMGDMAYWEQRMGMWGACLHNEFDVAMFSHTGINSRVLYQAAMSLDLGVRLGKQLIELLIQRYDPVLARM